MSAPAWQLPTGVGNEDVLDHHQAQQVGLDRANPAAHAHASRSHPAT